MNAVTEPAEITTETTAFQRSVLRAMLELDGSNTSNEIAKQAGFKPEPVRACLARLRDAGLLGTEVNPDKGGPPLWHLRASVDTVRSMVAAPIPSANDGTPGDDEPAPEPGDTQAVDVVEAAPDPGGWIPWRGGECPVPEGVACWVRFRGGMVDICDAPKRLFWGRGIDEDNEDDIVAYRLDDPAPAQTQDADGWIPWSGGECPVPADAMVEIKTPSGATVRGRADEFFWGWSELAGRCRNAFSYRLAKSAHAITAAYSAAVATESAADFAPLAGDDVCSDDAVIADWKREHAPAAPTIAPADTFAVWLADTPAGCAGQRAIDAAEQEAARLEAEAAEMAREAAETRQRGLIVAEIIRFADQRNASTSTSEEEFGLAELLKAAYEAVTGKRVA